MWMNKSSTFFTPVEYLTQAADVMFDGDNQRDRNAWLDVHGSLLKDDWHGARTIL
jgi:hypothetical protein